MQRFTKLIGLVLATMFLMTTLAIAAGIPGIVKEVKGSTVVVSGSDGKEHMIPVRKDAAAQLQPGDQVTVDAKGRIQKAK